MRRLSLPWITLVPLLTVACSGDMGGSSHVVPLAPEANDGSAGLVIELRAERLEYRVGESLRFEAELVNGGGTPATVILPGDGSDAGWRTPIVHWTPDQGLVLRCGNTDPLTADELMALLPGQRVALQFLGAPVFDKPGPCAVTLELEHNPTLNRSGFPLGVDDADTLERLRRLPAYRVRSNTLQVLVRE